MEERDERGLLTPAPLRFLSSILPSLPFLPF